MTRPATPLSILDLAPIVSGGSAGQALRNTIDLARRAEAAGYRRYWLAEHHFTPGVASSAPALLIGQVAAATSTIRVGSAAVQTGHQTPLAIVEQFGILDALFEGRIDLGLGRSGQRRAEAIAELAATGRVPSANAAATRGPGRRRAADPEAVLVRQAARLVPPEAPLRTPAAARGRDPRLPRAGRRGARPGRRHARHPRRRPDRRGAGHRSRRRGVDLRQQRRPERRGGRRAGPGVRRELPRQPGHRARGRRGLPVGVPTLGPARRSPTSRCRPTWSWPTTTRRARRAGLALRAVGAQHPHRPGGDPVPDPRGGRPPRLDRRRPRARGRSGRHPVRGHRRVGRRPSSRRSRASPGPTSWSSRPSPTTTPTGSAATSCWPDEWFAARPPSRGRWHDQAARSRSTSPPTSRA